MIGPDRRYEVTAPTWYDRRRCQVCSATKHKDTIDIDAEGDKAL